MLFDKYFLLSYDVDSLGEVLGSFGSLDVAFQEHAVNAVNVYRGVCVACYFNLAYVVDYTVDADGLVNRAIEVFHLCEVDVTAAACIDYAGVVAYLLLGVVVL